jgi:hypothetical protein
VSGALAARLRPVAPAEAKAAVRQAAPAAVTSLVRWLLTVMTGLLVAHHVTSHAQALEYVTDLAPGVAAYVWSVGQKWWAEYRLRLAIAAPAGLARPPLDAPLSTRPSVTLIPKDITPMDYASLLSGASNVVAAEFQKLAPDALAALPDGLQASVTAVVNGLAAQAKAAADAEVEKATHQVPPALQPFAPAIEELINTGIADAQAGAEAKIAALMAAKASLTPPASPAAVLDHAQG